MIFKKERNSLFILALGLIGALACYQLFSLYQDLLPKNIAAPKYNIAPIEAIERHPPAVLPQYHNLFNLKETSVSHTDMDKKKAPTQVELCDEEMVIRVRGIAIGDNLREAYLEIKKSKKNRGKEKVKKSKGEEIVRVIKGDRIGGFSVVGIQPDRVKFATDNGEEITVKVFPRKGNYRP